MEDDSTPIPGGQRLETGFSGADWLDWASETMSPLGRTVADVLGFVWRGIYHLPPSSLKKADWSDEHCISVWVPSGLATFDDDKLTLLVVVCHDLGLRLDIDSHGPRRLKLSFWQRRARAGRLGQRMPELETHVAGIRSGYRVLPPGELG